MTAGHSTLDIVKKINWALVVAVVAIVVPTCFNAAPYVLKHVNPERQLEFKLTGPINVESQHALEVAIENRGSATAKDVKVVVSGWRSSALPPRKNPLDGFIAKSQQNIEVVAEEGRYVIKLGSLVPQESAKVSILTNMLISHYDGIVVRSEEGLAVAEKMPKPRDAMEEFLGSFVNALMMLAALGLLAAIWETFFESPEAKEKRLLAQIDRLPKKPPEASK